MHLRVVARLLTLPFHVGQGLSSKEALTKCRDKAVATLGGKTALPTSNQTPIRKSEEPHQGLKEPGVNRPGTSGPRNEKG